MTAGRRSLLERGPQPGELRPGHVPVTGVQVRLADCTRYIANVCHRENIADIDDEVQEAAIRAWLSGRGLPAEPGHALRYLGRVVRQRCSRPRRSCLRRWKHELHANNAHPTETTSHGLLDGGWAATSRWSTAASEARVDFASILREALRSQGDRAAALLEAASGERENVEVAAELQLSRERVRQLRGDLVTALRAWAWAPRRIRRT